MRHNKKHKTGYAFKSKPWLCPDFDCRFHYPKPLVLETKVGENLNIDMERQHHWTNGYNPIFTACLRSNTDIQPLWGADQKGMAMVFYMTNYSTKQQRSLQKMFGIIKATVDNFQKQQKRELTNGCERSDPRSKLWQRTEWQEETARHDRQATSPTTQLCARRKMNNAA